MGKLLPSAAALVVASLMVTDASAQRIDLTLNLDYADEFDIGSGGTWEVVAQTTDAGLALVSFVLQGVDASATPGLPLGSVNGSSGANAGFNIFGAVSVGGALEVATGQFLLDPPTGDEAGAFYGVGTIANGVPGAIGPNLTTLANTSNVPWATGDFLNDPAFSDAAVVATGTFSAGLRPRFGDPSSDRTRGSVFTSVGTAGSVGDTSDPDSTVVVANRVRNDLNLPDYNNDGLVNTADFTIWRDTNGTTVAAGTGADGNGDGMVDINDYQIWKANFGAVVTSPGAGSATATPEPAGLAAAAVIAMVAAGFRREKTGFFAAALA